MKDPNNNLTEIPVIFPSHVAKPQRYVINDVERTAKRIHPNAVNNNNVEPTLLEDGANHSIHHGSASVSPLHFHASGRRAILSTSALVEHPGVLAVALSSTGNNLETPVVVELDLAQCTQIYAPTTIRVQAFAETRRDQECIRLVLVSDNAVVMTVYLSLDSLCPLQQQQYDDDDEYDNGPVVQVLNLRDLLEEQHEGMKEAVSGSLLHKTMVDFYAPHLIMVALSPLLMSVNLDTKECHVWLESRCLEDMRARRSTIGNIFSKATDIVLGKNEHGGLMDMAPTAALCVSSTANALLDPTYIFTLHSDGKIRRWTVNDVSLLPTEVVPLTITDMPHPRDWSDAYNSVYLTARLYNQVYVLAVHIQTVGAASHHHYDSDGDNEEDVSDSNLFVVYGGQDAGIQSTAVISSHTLSVPSEADSLVDMDFVPNVDSCSLMAMFRSTTRDTKRNGTTLTVHYPPSVVSIISTHPQVAPTEYFLDGVAQAERARIEALVFNDDLLGNTMNDMSLEEQLHEMDSRFMKILFRPAYPRGSGTVAPPQEFHIRRALQKLVYGRTQRSNDGGAAQSIELETLKAIYEWRSKENRNRLSLSPLKGKKRTGTTAADTSAEKTLPAMILAPQTPRPKATSVYESYVATEFDDEIMEEDEAYTEQQGDSDDDEMSDAVEDRNERERSLQLEMHARLWRRLLVAIWKEEQSLRSPLCLCLLDNTIPGNGGTAMLVRSGFTSIITNKEGERQAHSGVLQHFDESAIKLMRTIESDENNFRKLHSIEQRIWKHMAKAQLDEMTPSDFAEGYSKVVDFALDDSTGGAAFSTQEQQKLAKAFGRVSLEDSSRFLQETPQSSLPGLNLFGETRNIDLYERGASSHQMIANNQLRQAVCALSVRCVDESRRLSLGRFLLLAYFSRSSRVSSTAFYLYLRSLAVLWAASQEVPMPTAFKNKAGFSSKDREPPNKRLSFGDDAASVLSNVSATTCMDALLISILQTRDDSSNASLLGCVVSLGHEIFCSSLRSTIASSSDISSGKLWKLLPELGALPKLSDPTVATEYPRLALRLLAPLVALSAAQEAPNVRTARREALAECLLVESRKQLNDSAMSALRVKACELLNSGGIETGNSKKTKLALEALLDMSASTPIERSLSEQEVSVLARQLQAIIYGEEPEIRSGIIRLAGLDTVQKLFSPMLFEANLKGEIQEAVKVLSPKLLHLSDLMHRVDILEFHSSRAQEQSSSDLVIEFIGSTISELRTLFPTDFCMLMPEYIGLYNRLFHAATRAREWNQAYDACVNHPSSERKVVHFKRLVNSMIEAGALQDLLDKCSTLASSTESECVDLYDLATDALKESCSRDLFLVRASAEDPSTAAPDYQGSLYALHVSRGEWRKAAQCLDLSFYQAMQALQNEPSGLSQDSNVAAVRENIIVETLVLASVGAANAIGLVHDVAAQFIVSGDDEEGLPSNARFSDKSPKRRRQPETGADYDPDEAPSADRVSAYTNADDLHIRALWSLAFRTMCMDSMVNSSVAKSALTTNGSPCVDKEALDQLFGHGYYLPALLLTLAMSKANAAHRYRFYNALRYCLGNCLVPLSIDGHFTPDQSALQRPVLSQLRRALDSVDNFPGNSPFLLISRSKQLSGLIESSVRASSSALVEKLTHLHSNAEHPVALDVANFILDFDETIAGIPSWLSSLLLGEDAVDSSSCGLFARRPKPGSKIFLGDPSALLTLYTKKGLFLEACKVVTAILMGKDDNASRKQKAPSRLPEKGDIDFVPYKKIDVLHTLIDRCIGRGDLDEGSAKELKAARDEMVKALEQHFALMKISEMGIRSARALSQNSSFLKKPAVYSS